MLGCAIAEGIFTKQNILLGGKSLAGKLRGCKNDMSGSFGKLPVINSRHNHSKTIIHGRSGAAGSERCGLQRFSSSYNPAVKIQTRRSSSQITKPYDVDTNLTKDVILYKYDNPKYFKRLNIFGFSQLLFWTYLAQFVFTQLKDVTVPEKQANGDDFPWWRRINFGEKTNRTILTCFTFFVGYSIFALTWIHTLKSVRYLVLRKGGNDLTFVTYTPFGTNRLRTVPLDKMTSKQSREAATVQLPIKVKGDWMHYLLDMRGEFRHPKLFDFTAGLKRPI